MKLANCVKRSIALAIDLLIIGVVDFSLLMIILAIPTKIANVRTFNEIYRDTALAFIVKTIGFTVYTLYFVVLETKYNATLGKMALKIRLRTENGEKISGSRVFIRYLLFLTTGVTGIGFIFYLFSKKNQFLHDWLTKTYVE